MAHITSEEYLNKSNIEEYLDALAATLKTNGISAKDVMDNFIRLYGDEYLLRNDVRKIRLMGVQFNK
jgi:hypothetical protein